MYKPSRNILAALAISSSPVFATGIPTVDVANILQTSLTAFENIEQTVTMTEQYAQQIEQYEQQLRDFEQQVKTYETMVGSRDMSGLLNDLNAMKYREWTPEEFDSLMDTLAAGGMPSGDAEWNAAFERVSGNISTPHSSDIIGFESSYDGMDSQYNYSVASNNSAVTTSEIALNRRKQNVENIHTLLSEIDKAEDLKAAMDLNNRLLVEILIYQNDEITISATQAQNVGVSNAAQTKYIATEQQINAYQ